MVLVGVREYDAEHVAALFDHVTDVGKDQVDAGQVVAREGDAEIDHDPLAATLVANPVDGEVPAELAKAAERREHERVGRPRHHPSPLPDRPGPTSWTTSPAAMVRRSPSGSTSSRQPASSSVSNTPASSRSGRRRRITSPI